ncbi:MAG: HAD hydrolase-like protein, partial [Campylobacterota bacterium]|nr:HAD hydrolase-like protein [Campylobacterota bacterium]
PILKAIDALTCKKESCWMIGDTRLDIASANSAGIKSVAVLSGYDTHEQLEPLCGLIKADAYSAVELIIEINKRMNQCTL